MELVGHLQKLDKRGKRILVDFRCTNKEVFTDLVVAPALQNIPDTLVRLFLQRQEDPQTRKPLQQWVIVHWEKME